MSDSRLKENFERCLPLVISIRAGTVFFHSDWILEFVSNITIGVDLLSLVPLTMAHQALLAFRSGEPFLEILLATLALPNGRKIEEDHSMTAVFRGILSREGTEENKLLRSRIGDGSKQQRREADSNLVCLPKVEAMSSSIYC